MEESIFDAVENEDAEDLSFEDDFSGLDIDEINKLFTNEFTINPTLWEDANRINEYINDDDIHEIKYVRNDLQAYDQDVETLPLDKGGLYFFFIKPPINFNKIQYLVYIGRARFTARNKQNLRKRCREYFYDFKNVDKNDERTRKVRRMIKRWGKYLYLNYIELSDNTLIDSLETLLINNIRPPFNSIVPNKIYYRPQDAFEEES